MKELIRALRCSSTPKSGCIGKECRYFKIEVVPPELVDLIGETIWESCDCDKIAQDAADKLEELTGGGEPDA